MKKRRQKPDIEPKWLRIPQAAVYMGIGQTKLRELINENQLPYTTLPGKSRVKLLKKDDIDMVLDSMKTTPQQINDEFSKKLDSFVKDLL